MCGATALNDGGLDKKGEVTRDGKASKKHQLNFSRPENLGLKRLDLALH